MTGLRRFLHLERARAAAATPEAPPVSRERFGAVDATDDELAHGAGAPVETPAEVSGRFSEPPVRAPDVAAPAPEDAQPFVRCCRCGSDNSLYVDRCAHCSAALDTAEQRTFNEGLWATRRAEAQQLDEEVRRLRESAARAEEEAYRARRQMGEVIAREVGRQERERLDREGFGSLGGRSGRWGTDDDGRWTSGGDVPGPWGSGERDARPIGIRLLYAIQDPGRRLAAIAVLVSVFVFLIAAGLLSPRLHQLIFVAVALFAVLFSPRTRGRWRW